MTFMMSVHADGITITTVDENMRLELIGTNKNLIPTQTGDKTEQCTTILRYDITLCH